MVWEAHGAPVGKMRTVLKQRMFSVALESRGSLGTGVTLSS